MRVAFLGTPDVAVPALQALITSAEHEVVCVVTQPDRARGRGRSVTASPVKELATEHGLPILQPDNPKDETFAEALSSYSPEVLVVVAYGHILSKRVLEVAPAINAHFSLLPAYRGAAPVQRALMDGASHTGVSVFLLEPTVDSGPVLRRASTSVGDHEDAGALLERLAPMAADLLLESLAALQAGERGEPQDPAAASPAPKIKPEDQLLDPSLPAEVLAHRIRGLAPKPGAYVRIDGRRLVLLKARASAEDAGVPGTVRVQDGRLEIATGQGALEILELKPEGKRAMSTEEFLRGSRLVSGSQVDPL